MHHLLVLLNMEAHCSHALEITEPYWGVRKKARRSGPEEESPLGLRWSSHTTITRRGFYDQSYS